MPVVIPNGFMHVIQPLRLASASKDFSVTFAIQPATSGDVQDDLNEVFTDFKASWAPAMDNSYSILPSVGYYRTSQGDLQLFTAAGSAQAGSVSVSSPPAQVAVAISKRTSFVGRSKRGRIYMPGILSEAGVDEAGNLTTAGVNGIQTVATAWLAKFSDGGISTGPMWLLHSSTADDPDTVESLVVQPIVRTQRRRLPKG